MGKLIVIFLLFGSVVFAQGTRPQVKFVTHSTVPVDPGWYPAAWSITNVRRSSPDNTNFMIGLGRKTRNGWVEVMLQRQYALHTSDWFVDFRLSRRLSQRAVMFMEVSPFLEKRAVYQFSRIEYRIGPVNLMVESENIWRRGKPLMLGIGPGISLPARKLVGRMKFAPAVSWQLRHHDPNFIRFYLAFPF